MQQLPLRLLPTPQKAGAAQIDTGDTVNQSDSRLLDVDGSQVAYATCAAGRDYPLFYPTTKNAHGRVLEAYFRKALSLGFDGVYHDDSGFNYYYPYTFDQWDRVSGYLDPVTLRPKALMGHVTLLSQEQEIRLAEIVKQANGVMVLNDQPMTRTLREYAQRGGVAGGRGGANLHFIEGSQEARMQSTHLHTNVALLRYGQQLVDRDPKYNKTCQLCVPGSDHHLPGCVWRNVLDHLDYGVLPYLYDGLFPRSQAPNILAQLYPITVLEIGPGLVRGKERIVTRHPGVSYGFGSGVALDVYTYDKGVLLNVSHHVTGPVPAGFNADTGAAVFVRSTPETLKTDDEPSTCGIDSGAPRYGNPFAFYDQLTVQSGSPPWPASEATIGERRGITAHSRFQMVGQRWWCSVPGCNGTWPEADIFSLFPSIADGWNFSSCADLESPLILNGGVPQRAPLAEQLARIDKLIATWLPDPKYDGLAALDFEYWTPIWEEHTSSGSWHGRRYQTLSLATVRCDHPDWNETRVQKEAQQQFEAAAVEWLAAVLDRLHAHRPNTRFGYYGLPNSYLGVSYNSPAGSYLRDRNDKCARLWSASGAIYPSIYLEEGGVATAAQQRAYVESMVNESRRLALGANVSSHAWTSRETGPRPLVLPFQESYYHCYGHGCNDHLEIALSRADLLATLQIPFEQGADGVVLWDTPLAWNRVNDTIKNISSGLLGNTTRSIIDQACACSAAQCHGHGRCIDANATCECYSGFCGDSCGEPCGAGASKTDDADAAWWTETSLVRVMPSAVRPSQPATSVDVALAGPSRLKPVPFAPLLMRVRCRQRARKLPNPSSHKHKRHMVGGRHGRQRLARCFVGAGRFCLCARDCAQLAGKRRLVARPVSPSAEGACGRRCHHISVVHGLRSSQHSPTNLHAVRGATPKRHSHQ